MLKRKYSDKSYNQAVNLDTERRLVKELFVLCAYPGRGGSSEISIRNLSRLFLKLSNEVTVVNLEGKIFQSFADLTGKLSSKIVKILPRNFGSDFTTALMAADLSWYLNSILTLFGLKLFNIFHTCKIMALSLRRWRDIIPSFFNRSQ